MTLIILQTIAGFLFGYFGTNLIHTVVEAFSKSKITNRIFSMLCFGFVFAVLVYTLVTR